MKNLTRPQKYALWNGLAGLVIGISIDVFVNYTGIFAAGATLSAALCAYVFWKLVVGSTVTTARLVICALLTGIVSHYICWQFVYLVQAIVNDNYRDVLSAPLIFSLYSLFLLGWLSVLLSYLIGWFITKRQ